MSKILDSDLTTARAVGRRPAADAGVNIQEEADPLLDEVNRLTNETFARTAATKSAERAARQEAAAAERAARRAAKKEAEKLAEQAARREAARLAAQEKATDMEYRESFDEANLHPDANYEGNPLPKTAPNKPRIDIETGKRTGKLKFFKKKFE